MSRELPELGVSKPVQELRDAMDRVREVQGISGMVVDLARYDADTTDTNKEFLQEFLGALPAHLGYSRDWASDTKADRFEIEDPLLVRPTTTFGAIVGDNLHQEATLLIGQRQADEPKLPMTELLLVGQERTAESKRKRLPSSPRVTTLKVATDSWEERREANINRLATPYNSELLMSRFSGELGKFVINAGGLLSTSRIFSRTGVHILTRHDRSWYRSEEKRMSPGGLVGIQETVRSLRSSDFEAFEVMTHMEYIVAAYGIGKAFDKVKADREAKMPPHPATTVLGLPDDYRLMMEQRGIQALPEQA